MNRLSRVFLTLGSLSLVMLLLTACPPTVPTKTGTHQTMSFSASGTVVTVRPPSGTAPYPPSVSLDVLVQNYDDYSDGTSKLVGPANGVAVTLSSDDPNGKCIALSGTNLTTNAAGKAKATASAQAILQNCQVTFTATSVATNSPQTATVRNKVQ